MKRHSSTPGICSDDSIAAAGCKVLRLHYETMICHEQETRRGYQIESLHQMRIATRKLRVALSLFGNYLHPDQNKRLRKDLQHLGSILGRVRDLDIFWEKTARHHDDSVPKTSAGFAQMQNEWQAARNQHQEKVAAYLAGAKYKKFRKRFLQFLQPPFSPENPAVSVSCFAIQAIDARLQAVLLFRPVLQSPTLDDLHALRIAFKKLRYTIEFFLDLLGEDIEVCLELLKQVQDHIGDLNDARVTVDLLTNCIKLSKNQFYSHLLARKQQELSQLVATFAETWQAFDSHVLIENLSASYPE